MSWDAKLGLSSLQRPRPCHLHVTLTLKLLDLLKFDFFQPYQGIMDKYNLYIFKAYGVMFLAYLHIVT